MNSIETLTTFFGWCTVINFGLLLFVLLMWTGLRDFMSKLFMKIFDVTQESPKLLSSGSLCSTGWQLLY